MYKLREVVRDDMATINRWRNNPELIANLGAPFRYINYEVDVHWFDSYMAQRNSAIRCAVVSAERQEQIIGLVSLTNIDRLNQSATFHIMIGDSAKQDKGAGTFATTEMLKHAFLNMNLHRVELTVLADNARARHLYEKVGFVQEGMKHESNYKNGKFVDMYMYGILKEWFLEKADEK